MAYTATYEIADFDDLLFDFLGFIIAVFIANVTIIVTLVMISYVIFLFRGILIGLIGSLFSIGRKK